MLPSMRALWRVTLSAPGASRRRHLTTRKPSARSERRAYVARLRDRRDDLEASLGPAALSAAVLVERTPAVMPEPEDWEMAMWQLQQQLEVYDGFEYPKSVAGGTSAEADAAAAPRGVPDEIAALMGRETDADRADDRRSLERALADSLFLVVKPAAGDRWQLPRAPLADDEYCREAGERALAETCGDDLYTYVLGNAPVGVWDAEEAGALDRQFFMKAIVVDLYNSGPVDDARVADHAWITKAELPDYVDHDAEYLAFLQKLC